MCRFHCFKLFVVFLAVNSFSPTAQAVDAWQISEIFSNTDGTVQYVKLTTTSNNQQGLAGRTLRALNATGGVGQTFTFPSNLDSSQTANKSVLIGTIAFSGFTQLHVDYQLPPGFLFTEGGAVQLVDISSLAYQRTQLPRNGIQALRSDGAPVTANPVNFAGQSVTVDVAVPSLFNDSTAVVNLPVVDVPGSGIVNASLQLTKQDPLEFSLSDAYFYGSGVAAGQRAVRLLDGGVLSVPSVLVGGQLYQLNMTLINSNPIVFGNLAVVGVTAPPVVPALPPAPTPTPDPLAASIAAGESQYGNLCAVCHGNNGVGGQAPSLQGFPASAFAAVRNTINASMPQGNPGACVDSSVSTCATDIANFITRRLSGN
ncbi:MAG: cytochrome c [Gammaproteobacteria bacterium]|nr:cytochrome c [Gammaproteobacteria bacterium]MDP2141480.1 cytochrome c [Gammaproteobacteria bacterium]MDP2347495.1 cytochrome c [Gammaproteobacteria bacterium]